MSKAQFIRDNSGKLFNATVNGAVTIETWDDDVTRLIERANAAGLTATVTDNMVRLDNGQAWLKPALHKHYTATITFRSNDYIAARSDGNSSYGQTPPAGNFTSDSFTLDMYGHGTITYKLA